MTVNGSLNCCPAWSPTAGCCRTCRGEAGRPDIFLANLAQPGRPAAAAGSRGRDGVEPDTGLVAGRRARRLRVEPLGQLRHLGRQSRRQRAAEPDQQRGAGNRADLVADRVPRLRSSPTARGTESAVRHERDRHGRATARRPEGRSADVVAAEFHRVHDGVELRPRHRHLRLLESGSRPATHRWHRLERKPVGGAQRPAHRVLHDAVGPAAARDRRSHRAELRQITDLGNNTYPNWQPITSRKVEQRDTTSTDPHAHAARCAGPHAGDDPRRSCGLWWQAPASRRPLPFLRRPRVRPRSPARRTRRRAARVSRQRLRPCRATAGCPRAR